jgi:4-hydroxybenzoate polyprenyltransferase
VSAPATPPRSRARELGRFLEIQNLGLNLPFAVAFLVLAARGVPSLRIVVLVVIAFVAARNAGHSFNRWADRRLDARNPRTRDRTVAAGRTPPGVALAVALGSGAIVVAAAFFLNPLAFALSPVALGLVFGYSYTKRVTSFTTAFLGLVEAVTPAAVFIAVTGTLAPAVLLAVAGLLAWGTAFETVHSLGDLASDRALGLFSIPVRWGTRASVRLVAALHGAALALLALFGLALDLRVPYFAALAAIAALALLGDATLARDPTSTRVLFRRHFAMSALYLVGVLLAVFVPIGPALHGP